MKVKPRSLEKLRWSRVLAILGFPSHEGELWGLKMMGVSGLHNKDCKTHALIDVLQMCVQPLKALNRALHTSALGGSQKRDLGNSLAFRVRRVVLIAKLLGRPIHPTPLPQ